jgi:glycosyltransferase involved in cell wall biosynthesis
VRERRTREGEQPGTHVAIIVENVPLGVDIRVRKQVRDLLAEGYQVSVITMRAPENAAWHELTGLTVLEYPTPAEPNGALGYAREYGLSLVWAAALTGRLRRRGRIDVLQLSQPPDIYFPLAWVLRRLGARVLVDQRDLMPELLAARYERPSSTMMSALRWLERRTQRISDHTLCVNGYLRDRLIGAGADPSRLTIVRNGPTLARVEEASPDLALKTGHRYLCCWIGKMGRQDRVDLLLHAVAYLVHQLGRTDCGFAILGDGECLDELRSLSSELGLDPWVTFPGWLPEHEVFAYLASADLGVDTSLQEEVSPVKVMEYMAFGLPFVSFDLQETRAIGAGAAVFARPGDEVALAREIAALLDNPAHRKELARVGRRRVRDELAWERQSCAYLQALKTLPSRRVHA